MARVVDHEREYDNRGRVPEHPAIIEGWYRDAAAFRTDHQGTLDIAYGAHPRERLDLFTASAAAPGAAMLFIHGGYWQALDKAGFSHCAAGVLAHGHPVAVAGYPLCPEVDVGRIIDALKAAVVATAERTGRRVVVAGHSAGGHLAAAMLAAPWPENRRDLVPAALAISGLFDLEPLLRTSVNDAVGLDVASARAASPVLWPPPRGRRIDAWLGALESTEYHRQSLDLVRTWGEGGVDTEYEVLPDANHFTAIAPLAQPESRLTRRLVTFCAQAAPLA